jgi:hypothetical protein
VRRDTDEQPAQRVHLVRQHGNDLIVYGKTGRVRNNQVTAPGAWARASIKRKIRSNWWPLQ